MAESVEELFERFVLRFRLASLRLARFRLTRLVTGAQDCHGWTVEIGLDVRLKEIEEGDEGEAISSRRRVAALI